jgi:rhodanese-related sulfurtransferase
VGLALLTLLGTPTRAAAQETAPKGYRDYVAEANAIVTTLPVAEALGLLGDSAVAFIDLREQNELDRSGWIPAAVHAPRGLLEFYIDPTARSHMEVFSSGKRIVFYCAAGARSALAAKLAMEMGVADVAHIGGGFRAWVEAGGPVERSNR